MQLLLLICIEVYTLFQLWLISSSKLISWKTILLYLAVGTISVTAVTLTFHLFSVRIIPYKINSYTINPIIEEIVTILPIVLIARLSSLRNKLGVLDWMLLAAALGCGFQLAETGIRIVGTAQQWRFIVIGWGDIGRILTTWLPERIMDNGLGYAGHGIAAALMGLGVGLWNKYKRWGVFVLILAVAWCIFDHSLNNLVNNWFAQRAWARFLWRITSQGKLMPWALTLGVITVSLQNLYRKGSLENYRPILKRWLGTVTSLVHMLGTPSFRQYVLTRPKHAWLNWLANFKRKPYTRKAFAVIKIYFWLSFILVFFLNGIIPKSVYKWYFKTPLWWSVGLIGNCFAIYVAWCFFKKWRSHHQTVSPDADAISFGRGILSITSLFFITGSIYTLYLKVNGTTVYLKDYFLYQAAGTFLRFMRNGIPSLLGSLNGMGGFTSNTFDNDTHSIPEDSTHHYMSGSWNGDTSFDAELGQVVYISVRNVNILGTTITIDSNHDHSQSLILLPQQERIFRFDYFAAVPHGWHFNVSTNSDAFMVTYEIRSTWVPGMPPTQ